MKGKLWVIGGWDGSSGLRVVDIFDTTSGQWSEGPQLNKHRWGSWCVMTDPRTLCVFSGNGESDSMETIDPTVEDGSWSLQPLPTFLLNATGSMRRFNFALIGV